jgi:5-enolpyruvylshikimate-3-phosphate synthase
MSLKCAEETRSVESDISTSEFLLAAANIIQNTTQNK